MNIFRLHVRPLRKKRNRWLDISNIPYLLNVVYVYAT
jgi:hypothetical protein